VLGAPIGDTNALEANEEADDIYIDSIKAKLALLASFNI
jgi:hypothetical protein